MPYSSDAQRRWAHTNSAKKAGFPTDEFDKASKGKKLPEKVKKMAQGGAVSPYPDNAQMIEETNEERHPEANDEEFMAEGGLAELLQGGKTDYNEPGIKDSTVSDILLPLLLGKMGGVTEGMGERLGSEAGEFTLGKAPEMEGMAPEVEVYVKGIQKGYKGSPDVKLYGVKGSPENLMKHFNDPNPGSVPESILKEKGFLPSESISVPGQNAPNTYAYGGSVTTPHREKSGPSINTTPEHKYNEGGMVDFLKKKFGSDKSDAQKADQIEPIQTSTDTARGYADGGEVDPNEITDVSELDKLSNTPNLPNPNKAPNAPPVFNPLASHPSSYPQNQPPAIPQPSPMTDYLANQKAELSQYGPEQQLAVEAAVRKGQNSPGSLIGQGLAGLGDAIMQGVGRTGNPGFLKGLQERQQAQGQQRIGAMEKAGQMQTQQAAQKMQLDTMDPSSALSQSKREQMEAPLAAMGLDAGVIEKMSASEMDNAMSMLKDLSIKDREIAVKRLELQVKIKDMMLTNQYHQGELGLKGQEIKTNAQKSLADMPLATRLENKLPGPGGKAQAGLEQTAGINEPTPEDIQAIQWAQSNPQDPRASKILSLHGIQ